ncbi:MAG: Bax inhibitor-1/YccA family protein [Phycisphaerales bacterium]
MRTANPAMKAFLDPQLLDRPAAASMTFGGTIAKTGILLGLCFTTATMAWQYMQGAPTGQGMIAVLGSAIAGLVVGLIVSFAPRTAPILAPVYALLQGAFVGFLSWVIPQHFNVPPGIVVQAMFLTFGIAAAVLLAFSLGLVRLSGTAMKVVVVATVGVGLYYALGMLLNMLGVGIVQLGWEAGWLGIGFSLFVVVLASLNLVLDFQFIEAGVTNKAPRYMEWYGAFGLLVTLVWLYIEVLRLLAKFNKR